MQKDNTRFEIDPYNSYQNYLYNRALRGLSIYSEKEVSEMEQKKKKKIEKDHKKVQKIINLLKQEVTNQLANDFFVRVFPNTEFTKSLVCHYGIVGDENHVNNLSFKLLGITKPLLVARLIEKKMLPKNFNELIPKEDAVRVCS